MKAMRSTIYARKDPYVLILWLGILGSVIIFLFLSFIYLYRKSDPGWVNFSMPEVFWISTLVIILSSASLYLSGSYFKKEQFRAYRSMLGITLFLGIVFCVSQIVGWNQLYFKGVFINGSTSGAFMYILSGFHLLHILGGIIVLLYAYTDAIRHATYVESFVQSLNPVKKARLKLITLYWHFVDVLWVYLFLFFLYHHR